MYSEELAQWRLDFKNAKKLLRRQDPLLRKLSIYHHRMSAVVDNSITERLTSEVEDLLLDSSKIDDDSRPLTFSEEDAARLNALNIQAKKLQTPIQWTWAAPAGTRLHELIHKRMWCYKLPASHVPGISILDADA
jgi:hypothetical protein